MSDKTEMLRYDNPSGRWCIGENELHCGDCFDICADTDTLPSIPVRIEMAASGWCLISPYGVLQLSNRRAKR